LQSKSEQGRAEFGQEADKSCFNMAFISLPLRPQYTCGAQNAILTETGKNFIANMCLYVQCVSPEPSCEALQNVVI
jgi:hypothetical protein